MLATLIHDAMKKLLEGNNQTLNILRQQYENAEIKELELTGSGFYANFEISQIAPRLQTNKSFQIGDLYGEIRGVQDGVGFVLFITNGKLDFLEGYTYGDEPWPENLSNYLLHFDSGQNRDLEKLELNF